MFIILDINIQLRRKKDLEITLSLLNYIHFLNLNYI